jgi:uncharacterized damage-inducible protein DinB
MNHQNAPRLARLALPVCLVTLLGIATIVPQAQQRQRTAAQLIGGNFNSVNRRLLDMAKDFPTDKYSYRITPEVRSFGDVIVHVASGNVYAAKAGKGENVKWDELDSKSFKSKAEIVSAFEKSITDSSATLKAIPEDKLAAAPDPWLAVMEHSAEHYGQLVVYYRANGLVPPESRPKK